MSGFVPTPSQDKFLIDATSWYHGSNPYSRLEAPAGYGKCQPYDELILTPNGWELMGNISIGSYVITEEGIPATVLDVFDNKDVEMYELTFSDSSKVKCCIDHLWEIQTTDMRKRGSSRVMSLRDMLPKINKEKTKKDTYTYSVILPKPIEFTDKYFIFSPYAMGYTLGNGSSSKYSLKVTIGNDDYLEILDNFEYDEVLSTTTKDNSVSTISISKEMREYYDSFGLQGVKSIDKWIPENYLLGSVAQRKALLAGLVDSDGTCSVNKAKFATSSLKLANDFVSLVRSLGGTAKISVGTTRIPIEYQVVFRTPYNPFRLKRKASNYKCKFLDVKGNKRIVSAEYIGKMDGKCILIDSPKHLYITNDYTVTHNTTILKTYLQKMGKRVKPLILAETNEAVQVLKSNLGDYYEVKTVCSALNLVVDNSEDSTDLIQHTPPDLSMYTLIIVDEASQISIDRLEYLMGLGIYIMFVGHRSQLPPVETSLGRYDKCISPVFTQEKFAQFKLTEPVRNTTEIWEFCNKLEELIYKIGVPPNTFNVKSNFLSQYLSNIEGVEGFQEGKTLAIAYTNKRVAELNNLIREGIFGNHAEETYMVGDRVIFRKPAIGFKYAVLPNVHDISTLLSGKCPSYSFNINTKGVITKVSAKTIVNIDCFELTIKTNHWEKEKSTAVFYVPIVAKDFEVLERKLWGQAMYEHNPKARAAKWQVLAKARSIFEQIRYGYAVTSHCSQGSSIENVIVDTQDIKTCYNPVLKKKLDYVASSRSVNNLWRI